MHSDRKPKRKCTLTSLKKDPAFAQPNTVLIAAPNTHPTTKPTAQPDPKADSQVVEAIRAVSGPDFFPSSNLAHPDDKAVAASDKKTRFPHPIRHEIAQTHQDSALLCDLARQLMGSYQEHVLRRSRLVRYSKNGIDAFSQNIEALDHLLMEHRDLLNQVRDALKRVVTRYERIATRLLNWWDTPIQMVEAQISAVIGSVPPHTA